MAAASRERGADAFRGPCGRPHARSSWLAWREDRKERLAAPRRQLERTLVGRAVVHRLAVRNDDVLEGELEQRTERRQRPLLVPWRRPDAQFAAGRGERIGEDERPLLGKPQRSLAPTPAVVEGDESAREGA